MKSAVVLLVCIMGPLAANAQGYMEVSLTPVADSYVDDFQTSSTFGSNDYLNIQGTARNTTELLSVQRSFLRFSLSEIPTGATITGAVFGVFYAEQNKGDISTLDPSAELYYVNDDSWSENLDWVMSQSISVSSETVDDGPLMLGNFDEAHEWNLLSGYGFNWTNWQDDLEDGFISFMMKVESENLNNYAGFYSREYSDEALRPYLRITYTVVPEPATVAMLLSGIFGLGIAKKRYTL